MALRRTPLYEQHVAQGARMVDFGGWEMPVRYQSIIAEHRHTRSHTGLFDVSHMGEIEIYGEDAVASVDRLIANDLTAIADGQALYTAMCTPEGGIVDDLVVYRYNEGHVFICCNAANREKDLAWIRAHLQDATAEDRGDAYAQIAVQGREAEAILSTLTTTDLSAIKRYWFDLGELAGVDTMISRTGYTGEDGFELYMAPSRAAGVWQAIMKAGGDLVAPIGLGARDTLRLEMKYALYGNDIDETTTPLEAGIGWATRLQAGDFIGKEALVQQKANGIPRRLVGFRLDSKAPPRQGYEVVDEAGEAIGRVTSGTKSPSLGQNIGLAYVPHGQHRSGTPIRVRIRDRVETGEIVKTPFYKPA